MMRAKAQDRGVGLERDHQVLPASLPDALKRSGPALEEPASKKGRWRIRCSSRAQGIGNPIREIMDKLVTGEQPEKRLISLGQGDPTVYPHLQPCETAVHAVVSNLHSGGAHGYQPSQGAQSCRSALAEAFSVPGRPALTAGDVYMALGCSEALSHCVAALAADGCNMLLPRPGFPLYQVLCQYHGVEVRHYDLRPDAGWQADLESIRAAADERTSAIVINNPSNPCGAVYSKEHLQKLLSVAEDLGLVVIADEVYSGMSFEKPCVSCAEAMPSVPVLSVNSLSKRWLAPGWRVGWVVVYDVDDLLKQAGLPEALLKLCQVSLGPSAPLQAAIPSILQSVPDGSRWHLKTLTALKEGAQCCVRRCKSIPGLEVALEPEGALYMMVRLVPGALQGVERSGLTDSKAAQCDDVAFAKALLAEESILVLPGQCFNAPGYFRVVFAAPVDVLQEAWDRIEAFCRRRAQR